MAKKIYTLLDQNDFVTYAAFFEEGKQPVNAVPELVTTFMVKPKFIRASRTYQETATQAEIQAKIKEFNDGLTVQDNTLIKNLNITANYTVAPGDYSKFGMLTIYANASLSPITITLETPANMAQKVVTVVKTDSSTNSVTIQGNGANINEKTKLVLGTLNERTNIESSSVQYYITAS